MVTRTCSLDGCERERYQYQKMCVQHHSRWYRYGDPYHKPGPRYVDLRGQRFGTLVVRERVGNRWLCDCDCGGTRLAGTSGLNRSGGKSTCNSKSVRSAHYRVEVPGYTGAHDRVRTQRGSASTYPCCVCGGAASQWAYDHGDPDEATAVGPGGSVLHYSVKPQHYDPMCISCHKNYDLERIRDVERVSF
jgi:hypothetical protein